MKRKKINEINTVYGKYPRPVIIICQIRKRRRRNKRNFERQANQEKMLIGRVFDLSGKMKFQFCYQMKPKKIGKQKKKTGTTKNAQKWLFCHIIADKKIPPFLPSLFFQEGIAWLPCFHGDDNRWLAGCLPQSPQKQFSRRRCQNN